MSGRVTSPTTSTLARTSKPGHLRMALISTRSMHTWLPLINRRSVIRHWRSNWAWQCGSWSGQCQGPVDTVLRPEYRSVPAPPLDPAAKAGEIGNAKGRKRVRWLSLRHHAVLQSYLVVEDIGRMNRTSLVNRSRGALNACIALNLLHATNARPATQARSIHLHIFIHLPSRDPAFHSGIPQARIDAQQPLRNERLYFDLFR
jgi:hypothetical protein